MAVFRVEKTRDYTVMANYHLKDSSLTLKAKGLLSVMLSLPDEWNYTTRGLARICKEGVDSIGGALREMEQAGYIVRNQLRDAKGRIRDTEYVIYEKPQKPSTDLPDTALPYTDNPDTENPYMDNPDTDEPDTENPAQLNTYRSNTNPKNTLSQNPYPIKSYPINPAGAALDARLGGIRLAGLSLRAVGNGTDEMSEYREIVKENIEYDILLGDFPYSHERLDEIVELMAETLCSKKDLICVAGDDYPASAVKAKLLRLNSLHIQYVFECLDKNTTEIRNIKKYLLATLFNAPSTMGSYYKAQVNRDMYGI